MKYLNLICVVLLFVASNIFAQDDNKNQLSTEYIRMNGTYNEFNPTIQFNDREHYGDVVRLKFAKRLKKSIPIKPIAATYFTVGLSYQNNLFEHTYYDFNPFIEAEIATVQFSDGSNTYENVVTRRKELSVIETERIQTIDLGIQLATDDANHLKFEFSSMISTGLNVNRITEAYSRQVYTTTASGAPGSPISNTVTMAEGDIRLEDGVDQRLRYSPVLKWQTQFGARYDFGKSQRFGIRLFAETSYSGEPTTDGFTNTSKYGKLGIGTVFNI